METIKKFTAIQVGSKKINRTIKPTFEYGVVSGPYYDEQHPKEEFDTEEEAIEWAYNENPFGRWMILPIITFKTN